LNCDINTVRMIGGLGHLTINFPLYVGHLNSIFVLGVGNLTTKFQKVQMPRGMPGGDVNSIN
jgi:hypothetical protein